MRRLVLHREVMTDLTPAELSTVQGGDSRTRDIVCILSGQRTCEGQELTDTCPTPVRTILDQTHG